MRGRRSFTHVCMKIPLVILLAILILAALRPSASWGETAGETADRIRLTNGEWQPYLSRNAPHYGVASHIITEAFALVGVEVDFGFFPWSRAMKLAQDGSWDGSAIWGDSEERRQHFHYSDAIINSSWVFFHLKDSGFTWRNYEDLRNTKVGGTVSYHYGEDMETAEATGIIKILRGRSDEVGLMNLLRGRIDVFPGEILVTYAQIRDTFSAEEAAAFVHHPKKIDEKPLYLFFSKKVEGSAQMRDRFNKGLALLKESGRYDRILSDAIVGGYVQAH